jgi:hypothetical protein
MLVTLGVPFEQRAWVAAVDAAVESGQPLIVANVVELLRVKSRHPSEAMVELAGELGPGLLVFGPDRTKLSRRVYRRAAGALRERVGCPVWLADE